MSMSFAYSCQVLSRTEQVNLLSHDYFAGKVDQNRQILNSSWTGSGMVTEMPLIWDSFVHINSDELDRQISKITFATWLLQGAYIL